MLKTICVDAGHGGTDHGAHSADALFEKDCTLNFALLVGAALLDHGFYVYFTRQEDSTLSFEQRASIANMGGADGFLCLHCGEKASAPGARIFVNKQSEDALKWAGLIEKKIKKQLCPPLTLRGVQAGNYTSLAKLHMPALHLEIASIVHPKESRLLLDEQFLKKAALSIAEATVLCFQQAI